MSPLTALRDAVVGGVELAGVARAIVVRAVAGIDGVVRDPLEERARGVGLANQVAVAVKLAHYSQL